MKKKQQRDREHAIKFYLKGESITAIAPRLGYSRPWVYKWVERYQSGNEQELRGTPGTINCKRCLALLGVNDVMALEI